MGKRIIIKRKTAWYGDSDYLYTYSNTTRRALPWTSELRDLKQLVEKLTETKFNSCLLNLNHDGNEGMAWHSDDEKVLRRNGTIASLSFWSRESLHLSTKRLNKLFRLYLNTEVSL